jgi:transposase-like protein
MARTRPPYSPEFRQQMIDLVGVPGVLRRNSLGSSRRLLRRFGTGPTKPAPADALTL